MIYLESISVRNLGGIDTLDAKFSPVSIVTGENGASKTSLLNSVATVFRGGSDADLLKRGTKSGSVTIAFANGYKATKIIEPTKKPGYSLTVEDPNGGKITTGAATKVEEWVPKDGFDVRGLMRMVLEDPRGLTKFLLDHLPITFTPEEVNGVLGVKQVLKALSLPDLNSLRQAKYDERTGVKSTFRDLQGTIRSLEDAAGGDQDTDWAAKRDGLDEKLKDLDTQIATVKSEIKAEGDEKRAVKRTEIAKRIADLKAQIAAAESEETLFMAKVDGGQAEAFIRDTAAFQAEKTKVTGERAAASEKADLQQRSKGVREQIDRLRKEAEGHITRETLLTTVLENIDTLKTKKLKALPVEGLDIITDGKQPTITINGVPLERINTQQQIYTAIKFIAEAQKASGCEMRLLVCEGAELDEHHLIELGEACIEAGIQLVISMRIAGEPLRVMSLEEFQSKVAA